MEAPIGASFKTGNKACVGAKVRRSRTIDVMTNYIQAVAVSVIGVSTISEVINE